MRATTSFIQIVAPNSLLHLIGCNESLPRDLEIHTCDLRPLSCILANIKLSSWVRHCRSLMLIPGVATKVGIDIAALAVPALKGKKLSSSLVSQIRQNTREKVNDVNECHGNLLLRTGRRHFDGSSNDVCALLRLEPVQTRCLGM